MKNGTDAGDFRVPRGFGALIGLLAFAVGELVGWPRWASLALGCAAAAIFVSQLFVRHQSPQAPSEGVAPQQVVVQAPIDSVAERRQRGRNIAIGLALAVLVALFYVATIVRLGSNVANRAL